MANYGKYYIAVRLLLLKQYLEANAGRNRIVKRSELEDLLEEHDMPVEKKTFYADFAAVQAQSAANIRNIHDKQRIDSADYEETLRIQREEMQYAQRMQTRTSNFAAYQVEKQAEVGVAGANAFGQMNENGAGNLNIGDSGSFNLTAVMAGMAMGGTIGQNMANVMNTAMSGMNQPSSTGTVPPPIPTTTYHVAVNGQATGPFSFEILQQMVKAISLKKDTLVWKQGMANWAPVGSIEELKGIWVDIPSVPSM